MSRAKHLIFAALAMFAAGAATADTYYQKTTVTSDDSSQDPWCRSNIWTNSAGVACTITATGANSDPNTFVVSPGMELHAKMGKDAESVFPGETLVISAKGSSAGFLRPRQKTLTIPNLVLDGSEMTSDELTFIDNNGVGSEQVNLITTITGTNLTVNTPSGKWARINGAGGAWSQHTRIDSPLSGSGNLILNGQWAKDVTTYKNFYLTGDNSKFTGKLMLRGNSSTTPNLRLYVSAANQLGGNPETPQFDGIQLVRSSSLWFTDSMKIDLPNRGIYFNCYDGSTDRGKITVDEDCDVEYTGPWSFPSTDRTYWPFKNGKGRLYFSGGRFPGKSAGGFFIIEGILKFPAQHIVADSTALRITQDGTNPYKIVEFGSNGVARVNPTYFTFSSTLAIVDTATLEVTSANRPSAVTNIMIASQATLSMTGTAAVALNNVTLEDGATLAYHLSSTDTAIVPKLSINSGKSLSLPGTGSVKVKVAADEGLNFDFGAEYVLTANGNVPEDAVTSGKVVLTDDSVKWAKLSVNAESNLVVKVAKYFYINIAEEASGRLAVPVAWIDDNTSADGESSAAEIEAALQKTGANGILVWQSYCLGLDPQDGQSVVLCEAAADQPSEAGAFKFTTNVAVPDGLSGVEVTAYLDRKSSGGWVQQGEPRIIQHGEDVELPASVDSEDALSFFV